jgi:hypothetical protein
VKRFAKFLGIVLLIAAFGPWHSNPSRYVQWDDRFKTSIPIALVFGTPCWDSGADYYDHSPDCLKFEQQRRFKGIWLDQFEGSRFLEGDETLPTVSLSDRKFVWLTENEELEAAASQVSKDLSCIQATPYRIEFNGRNRDGGPMGAGHASMADADVWVDELISLRQIGEPYCVR